MDMVVGMPYPFYFYGSQYFKELKWLFPIWKYPLFPKWKLSLKPALVKDRLSIRRYAYTFDS